MIRYIIVSVTSGILFGVMDGLINGNRFAQKIYECFRPIAKSSVNITAGLAIDLIYGFIMTGMFMLLRQSLPGNSGLLRGICFAVIAWFFRVVMAVASQWTMFNVPAQALVYTLITGFVEMVVLGIFYGLTLS